MGDAIKLIGIVIVIIGFALKFDTLATVVVAGIVTGLVGGMSIMDILSTLGSAFLTNRTATLFILTLPVIGLCERMGLRDKAVDFISGIKSATTGRLLSIWQVIRTIASAFSLRIGGHPQFIRPLINPMAQACAIAKYGEIDEKTEDEIKGRKNIMGDAIKLIGIVIVIIGFALKFDTLATVVVAGIVTGLVGGMSIMDILSTLGSAFLTNRTATLFILTLPVIGLCERMGLRDKAVDFISGIKSATTGRLLSIWQVIRTIASAFSLRIGGHPQFIRPLINPMAQACAIAKYGEIDEKTEDEIKGMAAGTENYGNFFAQNCFMGSSGTLLIVSTLNEIFKSNNIAQEVTANQIALNSIPIAVISVIVGIGYALWYDRKLKKRFGKKQGGEK